MNTNHRLSELRSFMREEGMTLAIVMNPAHQFYLCGFKALIYSRPILLLIEETRTQFIVPGLEETHAREEANVDHVLVYHEYPEGQAKGTEPFTHVKSVLSDHPEHSTVGMDLENTPASLARHIKDLGYKISDIGGKIERQRYVKDQQEIERMTEAGELVGLAVKESLNVCTTGITELEVDAKGNAALFEAAAQQYPEATLDLTVMSPSGPKRSVMPHVFSNTRKLREGDVLIHSRQVGLNGYRAELERTLIIGEPTNRQKQAFRAATAAQEIALEMIRPGVKASDVDQAAREILRQEGFGEYAIHRVGHAIGVSAHEKPYLTFDNSLVLEEGMVFCVEPGIYIPGLGGFRHSDTVVLTSDGCRPLTDYPRSLDQLTV